MRRIINKSMESASPSVSIHPSLSGLARHAAAGGDGKTTAPDSEPSSGTREESTSGLHRGGDRPVEGDPAGGADRADEGHPQQRQHLAQRAVLAGPLTPDQRREPARQTKISAASIERDVAKSPRGVSPCPLDSSPGVGDACPASTGERRGTHALVYPGNLKPRH